MNRQFKEILVLAKDYNSRANVKLIEKAYNLAAEVHAGQKRLSGEDYINHPLAVACLLAGWRLDSVSVAAGLLHDVIEDGGFD